MMQFIPTVCQMCVMVKITGQYLEFEYHWILLPPSAMMSWFRRP